MLFIEPSTFKSSTGRRLCRLRIGYNMYIAMDGGRLRCI